MILLVNMAKSSLFSQCFRRCCCVPGRNKKVARKYKWTNYSQGACYFPQLTQSLGFNLIRKTTFEEVAEKLSFRNSAQEFNFASQFNFYSLTLWINFSIKIQVSVTVIGAFDFNNDTIFVIFFVTRKMETYVKYFCSSLFYSRVSSQKLDCFSSSRGKS